MTGRRQPDHPGAYISELGLFGFSPQDDLKTTNSALCNVNYQLVSSLPSGWSIEGADLSMWQVIFQISQSVRSPGVRNDVFCHILRDP